MRKKWPVNTFETVREQNYNQAKSYYLRKKQAIFNSVQLNCFNKLNKMLITIPAIEEIFENSFSDIENRILGGGWSQLYNKKYNQQSLQQAIKTWNSKNLQLQKSIVNGVSLLQFLRYLPNMNSSFANVTSTDLTNMPGIPSTKLNYIFNSLMQKQLTASTSAGYRASLFGEIIEQLAGSSIQGQIGDLLQFFSQVGTDKVLPSFLQGKSVQGKSDWLFSTMQIQKINLPKSTVLLSGRRVIPIDAIDLIDIQKGQLQNLSSYPLELGGISVKQWTKNMIKGTGLSSKASFGNFNISAQIVNKRQIKEGGKPKVISYGFDESRTFDAYTGYVISRYLTNVIGIYNIILVTGSDILFTDQFIDELQSKSQILAHKSKRAELVSRKRGSRDVNYYEAKSGIVIVKH